MFDFRELIVVNDRELHGNLSGVGGRGVQKVALGTEPTRHGGDHLLANRIQRWVRDLSELLCEVVKEQPGSIRDCRYRSVGTHGPQRLSTVLSHRRQEHPNFFLRVSKGALTSCDRRRRVHNVFALGKLFEFDAVVSDPVTPGFLVRQLLFQLVILDEATFHRVGQQH